MKNKVVWTVVLLVGFYVLCQAIADVTATKFVQLGQIVLPGGSMIFALTFTVRDLIHKRLGKDWARVTIISAALFNVFQALYFALIAALPWPPFFAYGEAWSNIFAIVPAITIASITAELISELVDTEVYHWWYNRFVLKPVVSMTPPKDVRLHTRTRRWQPQLPQWTAVLASNIISLPLDSLIFGTLAFTILPHVMGGEPVSFAAAMTLVAGQIVWKAAVTVVSMPAIYLVKFNPVDVEVD